MLDLLRTKSKDVWVEDLSLLPDKHTAFLRRTVAGVLLTLLRRPLLLLLLLLCYLSLCRFYRTGSLVYEGLG